jgi:hypothetical protein
VSGFGASTGGENEGLERFIGQLLSRQSETRNLDYKGPMSFAAADKADRCDIVKDLIAMSNVRDGGSILIGVEQVGGKFVPRGVTKEQAATFDITKIGDFARNYCSVLPTVTSHVVEIDGMDLVLLQVAEFGEEPIVCIKDMNKPGSTTEFILRKGSIYVRTSDARSVAIDSSESMRALLDLAVQKRGESLIGQIQRLVGAPIGSEVAVGDPLDAYASDLVSCEEFFKRESIATPHWFFELAPPPHRASRINTQGRLREIVQDSEVALRGWNFPHSDREHFSPFESGRESVTHWGMHHEAFRAFKNGLFVWRQELREDHSEQHSQSVSYVSAMYTIMEFFVFADRYVALLSDVERVTLRLGINGLRGRRLHADANVQFWQEYTTTADRFEQVYDVSVAELRAGIQELAARAAKQLFDLFDADVSIETIEEWQTKFLERRF